MVWEIPEGYALLCTMPYGFWLEQNGIRSVEEQDIGCYLGHSNGKSQELWDAVVYWFSVSAAFRGVHCWSFFFFVRSEGFIILGVFSFMEVNLLNRK